ncbi:MAG: protein-L-isoaspartate(D-aspartate) O-methyltransferase [Bdellovibrionales bacterium]
MFLENTLNAATPSQVDTRKIRLIMDLRSQGVKDTNVLSAIETVPREVFVSTNFEDQAYENRALSIGLGQTISQPLIVGIMTQALQLNDRHKVLEIGTGSGYQATILASLCRRLYTIERHKPLLEQAEKRFEFLKVRNITAVAGDGMKGWREQAPFERIIVTAAAKYKAPSVLIEQLAPGGLMVIPVELSNGEQVLRLYKKEGDDTYSMKDIMPVRFVPLLPDVAEEGVL